MCDRSKRTDSQLIHVFFEVCARRQCALTSNDVAPHVSTYHVQTAWGVGEENLPSTMDAVLLLLHKEKMNALFRIFAILVILVLH